MSSGQGKTDLNRIEELERSLEALRQERIESADLLQINQGLYELMPGGIVYVTAEGAILKANQEARRLLGYSYDDLTRRYVSDWDPITLQEDGSNFPMEEYPVTRALRTGEAQGPVTIGVRRPDGETFWAVFRAMPLFAEEDRRVTGALVVFIDVTEKKKRILELKQKEEELSQLIEHIPHYIAFFDSSGKILYINHVAEQTTKSEVLSMSFFDYVEPDTHEEHRQRMARVLETGVPESYENEIDVNGRRMFLNQVWWRATLDGRTVIGSVATDVTRLRELNEKLLYQATHDPLTGLANRLQFESDVIEAIEKARREKRRYALCYLDLDQFKIVNDTCGHLAGDELLRQLSGELKRNVPDSTQVARLGGDEFGLLLEETTPEAALQQVNALRVVVDQFRFYWEERVFRVGASIGVAMIDQSTESFTQLLKDADFACFVAKDSGRNMVHLFSAEDQGLTKRRGEMFTVNDLTLALEHGNFDLYFQKIQSLENSGSTFAIEILLRLLGSDGTPILPGLFIPAAERFDLMDRIDRWVLRSTFDWMEKNPRLVDRVDFVSINLSGKSLGDERFQRFCVGLIEHLSLPIDKLRFEITETAAFASPDKTSEFIHDLRRRGLHFALDDFGSGLSSFEYLRNLPIDLLKIDGSFVRRIHEDPVDFSMLKCIHELACSMSLKTVAEFVENEAIMQLLREIGVHYAQGFYLHKPLPLVSLG